MNYYSLDYSSINAGDWIQSLASLQFYPEITHTINRDSGKINRTDELFKNDEESFMIYNGWTNTAVGDFSYLENIKNILPISVNLQPMCFEEMPKFFKNNEVGLRDFNSYDKLKEINNNSYFSSCMTLLLKSNKQKNKTGKIIINELDRMWNGDGPVSQMGKDNLNKFKKDLIYEIPSDEYYKNMKDRIPKNILDNAIFTDHDIYELREGTYKDSMETCIRLLDEYNNADLVITSRLHTALPCLALDTPVIFIWWEGDWRLRGLSNLFKNFYDISKYSNNQINYEISENKNIDMFNNLKNSMLNKIESFMYKSNLNFEYNSYEKIIDKI